MKKLLFVCMFVSAVSGMLAGCNDSPSPEPAPVPTPTPSIQEPEQVRKEAKAGDAPAPQDRKIQQPEDPFVSLIPEGWRILEIQKDVPVKAEGDINQDGILDAAVVLEQTKSPNEEAPARSLLIAFGEKDHSYSLSILADHVILKADEGGIWGDPFEGITINRGSIVVSHYGGSNWRWYNDYRFRYQDNDWYLIGVTTGSYYTGNAIQENADEEDYNLLTGDYILQRTDEQGKTKQIKGNLGKHDLAPLRDFHIQDANFPKINEESLAK
ncbi:hypothetical protein [Paenibacillus turpanensis]|uniref:hypothetical protein n=1 Tax=Paenibacillus turpanensis TaxID=2689078 RepID=UPI00140DD295|nr:hypothetical protein [Paenibacillus turpanensis]